MAENKPNNAAGVFAAIKSVLRGIFGSPIGKILFFVIYFVLFLGLMVFVMYKVEDGSKVAMGVGVAYMVIALPFGWRALNRITPDVFLIMPIIGWLIFFLIKGFLSLLIGGFALPFVIVKAFSDVTSNAIRKS